jgi:hypothetical protein
MAPTPPTRAAVRWVLMRYCEYSAAATGRCSAVCGALHGRVERRKKPCANKTSKQTNKQTNKSTNKQTNQQTNKSTNKQANKQIKLNRPRSQPDDKQNNRQSTPGRRLFLANQQTNNRTEGGRPSQGHSGCTRGVLGVPWVLRCALNLCTS